MKDDANHEALEDLLDRERAALLEGNIDALTRLADEKESLLQTLADYPPATLEILQAKAARNQELLNSALEGIRSVANRLKALREVRNALNTYDRQGQRHSIEGLARPKVERRA